VREFFKVTDLILFCLASNFVFASQPDHRIAQAAQSDPSILSEADKAQLLEFNRLKKEWGNRVWPGFEETFIPVLLFNRTWEFLVGHADPPETWSRVAQDEFQGFPYYRRQAQQPQAFTARIGTLWASSLNTLEDMNQSMEELLRERSAEEGLTAAMRKMFQISPGYHVTALLHEAFHAFQAMRTPERFRRAEEAYVGEKIYPYKDPEFKKTWNKEGELLAAALLEKEESVCRDIVVSFLEVRRQRREVARLPDRLADFEKDLEWLEGLGKYAEMRFAELAASGSEEDKAKDYRIVSNRSRYDLFFRLNKLGELTGDHRFYLSGVVQAFLLDRFLPGWKDRLMDDQLLSLEDLLAQALEKS
jgi:hypothetical protein